MSDSELLKGQRVISQHNINCLEDVYNQFSLALFKLRLVHCFYVGGCHISTFSDEDRNNAELAFWDCLGLLDDSLFALHVFFNCVCSGCDMNSED